MKQAASVGGSPQDVDLRQELRAAAARLGKPSTANDLRRALPKARQRPAAEITRILAEMAREGSIFAVKEGSALKYADREPAAVLEPAIRAALRDGPLTKTELTARVKRTAPGFEKSLAKVLTVEIARGAVREHPKAGKGALRYGLEPPDPAPHLTKVVKALGALQKKLASSGVTPAAIHAALGRALGVERAPARDTESDDALVLAALHDLAAREPPGSLLAVRAVRARVPLDKEPFDRAALRLAQAGALVLHHHDFPESLAEAERARLVRDERGVHYGGIAPRERRGGP
ncbi:Hypothetical protein A7982_08388 [Minicystis rosea]|nr:Hypothetical protein A7982_08388 [Minicystis rosea]